MSEEMQDGAAEEPIVNEAEEQAQPEAQKAEGMSKEDFDKLLEERDRKWQSKFDKVLAEKKAEAEKAMTVEERLEQLERERQRERVDWSRKEARARAEIDDSLDEAIRLYASDSPDEIGEGATKIKELFEARISEYKARIDELEKKLQYGGKAPAGGGKGSKGLESMSVDEQMAYAQRGPNEQAEVLAFMQSQKKNKQGAK